MSSVIFEKQLFYVHNYWETTLQGPQPLRTSHSKSQLLRNGPYTKSHRKTEVVEETTITKYYGKIESPKEKKILICVRF